MDRAPYEIKNRLIEALSPEKGYFSRITSPKQQSGYQYIGFILSEDIEPMVEKMTDQEGASLGRIINYFVIHASSLKSMLKASEESNTIYRYYADISWSQFSTVIMFGMLEYAILAEGKAELKNGRIRRKAQEVKRFLEDNLSIETKENIVHKYDNGKDERGSLKFDEVIHDLYDNIRSGFIHEASINSIGSEYFSIKGSGGTEEDPMIIRGEIPMQQWLQITWQAILNSYGYKGILKHPEVKRLELTS